MSNLHKIYLFKFFWLFIVVLPVLYPYYASLGINMHEFFLLQAVFGLTVALFDIPAGYFSDVFGRKLSLCIGSFLSGIGYLVLFYATDFWWLALHEALLGLALSFISGTDIAILYDALPAQDNPHLEGQKRTSALGLSQLSYSAGEAVGSLATGLLVVLSFQHVVVAQMLLSWVPLCVALTLKEPVRATLHPTRLRENWHNITFIWKHLLSTDGFRRLLALNFVFWYLCAFIIIWLAQRYWQDNGVPLALFGVLWAVYNICIGIAAFFTQRLEQRFGFRKLVSTTAWLCLTGYLAMTFLHGWWGIAVVPVIYVARGILNVVYRDILNRSVPAHLRATANSILNFLFRSSFAVVGPLIGLSIDRWGLRPSLAVTGVLFFIGYFILTRPLLGLIQPEVR